MDDTASFSCPREFISVSLVVDGFLCSAMFRDAGEAGKETEHAEAEGKKLEELHRRIEEAQATPYHAPLLQVCSLRQFKEWDPQCSSVITCVKTAYSYL